MSRKEMREEGGKEAVITGRQRIWRIPQQGDILSARSTLIFPVTSESFSRLEDHEEQLHPGLSNEIVLEQIAPKLPWKAFHILSSVSRSWRQAIRSHHVFEARVRSHSADTLFLLNFTHSLLNTSMGVDALCLYFVKEEIWHRLPDFAHKRYPDRYGCVSLDGKVYVSGGQGKDYCNFDSVDSKEVYVLDLAGQTGWRQCASILEPRQGFALGVIDGKIYVVGGTACGRTIRRSEVYDPKESTWSSINPMILTRYDHKFVTVGEELWLYGGLFFNQDCEFLKRDENKAEDEPLSSWWICCEGVKRDAMFPEVYRPSSGEWELVKTLELDRTDIMRRKVNYILWVIIASVSMMAMTMNVGESCARLSFLELKITG